MSTNNSSSAFVPLQEQQLNKITQAVSELSREQLIWTSGFLAGMAQGNVSVTSPAIADNAPAASITVLYGSQTGNAKHAASDYADQLKAKGLDVSLVNMADYKPRKIKDEAYLIVFVSTHGEGDAPDDAMELHEFLASKKAPKLNNLKYAVVGLGDSSYEFFCQTGKDFDTRLNKLGATPLSERLDCDVDYESAIAAWTEQLSVKLEALVASSSAATQVATQAVSQASQSSQYTKQNPFAATLSESLKITGRDSVKDIRHIEISLEDSGIQYQAGDALGVWFVNDSAVVDKIMAATQTKADDEVTVANESMPLSVALSERLELTLTYPGFVQAYQAATGNEELASLLADKATLRKFLDEHQIVDIVEKYPAKVSAQTLVDAMRAITPRLYSIASSQSEVEDEVHLTVAHVAYDAFGYQHQGGASGFLSTRLEEGAEVKVFVENNDNFRLPSDDNTPVIMIGPGTGIAPFRAFMQERDAREAEGKNWLFFGNPNFTQDFLYQTEWQGYKKSGLLTKISLAFSRDQEEKIYVQDRIKQHGQEVFEWLESGAHVYICGDALKMAKDVELALIELIQTHGKRSEKEAKEYLVGMRKAKRYQKDVY
ncbi:assimilatory sulfite reductase (NADPH) flavoprotein subunit [Agaribacter flavus]|uniref:Sulfite reductase [NADPH] flavoprotein alpha-component n=1 Tax=Agaribacter flavus TaxID=1902781 RepID=A0ABV7FP94_9ALTE